MAALQNPLDDPTTTGTTNTDTAGGSGSNTTGATGAGATGNPVAPSVAPDSPNVQDASKIGSLNQSFNFSPLLDTVRGEGTSARNAIDTANTGFNTGLGAQPIFGAAQQNTLSKVIDGTDTNQTDGTNILNYNPTTTGINNASYDPLVNQYQTDSRETNNQTGLTNLIGGLRPDLTPGELNYDSTAYGQNPNFKTQSQGIIDDSNNVFNLGAGTTSNAANALTKRATDIGTFQQAGKDFINGKISGINNDLDAEIIKENAVDHTTGMDFSNFKSGVTTPTGINHAELSFDPTAWLPKQTVESQYNPPDNANMVWKKDPITGQTTATLTDPNTSTPVTWSVDANGNTVPTIGPTTGGLPFAAQQGVYRQSIDPGQYMSLTNGTAATRQNVATADQIKSYNNAQALLGNSDRLGANTAARPTSQINFDRAGFMNALAKMQNDRDAANTNFLAQHPDVNPDSTAPTTEPIPPAVVDPAAEAQALRDRQAVPSLSGDGGGMHEGGFVKRRNYDLGGQVPQNAGPSGVDTVPTNLNNGEFVLKTPSAGLIGQQDLTGLNQLNTSTPQQQSAVKNALHTALTRAVKQQGKKQVMS